MKTVEEVAKRLGLLIPKIIDKRVSDDIKELCRKEINTLLWVLEDSEDENN